MMCSMIRSLIAALIFIAAPAAAKVYVPSLPATVVVAFDREGVRPLIVEGLANMDTERPLEANDPVRIASVSKLIMALTALRLMDEGKVDLDNDASDYLGWKLRSPFHPDEPVTLTALLTHRAGLSDAAGYVIPLGESLEAKLVDPAAWRETGKPGEAAFEYANLGSPLVATALEAASGERYDRLVERLVFAPLGVKACLNWVGCDPGMHERAVTLYRENGEIARDGLEDMPPICTIPVAEGAACTLDAYIPGTNASVFSPQGGVRIGMVDLAKIGQRLLQPHADGFLSEDAMALWLGSFIGLPQEGQELFCGYGFGSQLIPTSGRVCHDQLFGDARIRVGHAGEAYGLQSGLWFDPVQGDGIAYFTTQVPPPPGGEDTGGFSQREIALMARAQQILSGTAD